MKMLFKNLIDSSSKKPIVINVSKKLKNSMEEAKLVGVKAAETFKKMFKD